MMNPLLLPEIRIMLAEGDAEGMAALVNDLHPASVAEFIEGLKVDEIWALLSHGDVDRQADKRECHSKQKANGRYPMCRPCPCGPGARHFQGRFVYPLTPIRRRHPNGLVPAEQNF